ncbi:MAG: hypothetical protein RL434_3014, partial [Pseudomonadota bacterium]
MLLGQECRASFTKEARGIVTKNLLDARARPVTHEGV